MAIIVDDKTKLVIQGITGYQGMYHSQAMREFGTQVVAGVRPGKAGEQGGGRARNYPWAQLMARVFELDVLACPGCGARMRILAAINTPEAIRKILSCLGFPMRPPPVALAMPDGDAGDLW